MSYDDSKQFCEKSREDDNFYRRTDRLKKRYQGRLCISIENKNTYTECVPETWLFNKRNVIYKNNLWWFRKLEDLVSLQNQAKELRF